MSDSATRHGGGTATAPSAVPGPAGDSGRRPAPRGWIGGLIEFVYRLAGSTLATPRVAMGVSLVGLALIMTVGILSPNFNTLPPNSTGDPALLKAIVLPLSGHLWRLA